MEVFSRGLKRGIQAFDTGYFTAVSMSIEGCEELTSATGAIQDLASMAAFRVAGRKSSIELDHYHPNFRDSPSRAGVRQLKPYGEV
jgi:hypothetical protein